MAQERQLLRPQKLAPMRLQGGGEYIAFDVRGSAPWPIVYIDVCNVDLEESVPPLAVDFDSLLALIGLDARTPINPTQNSKEPKNFWNWASAKRGSTVGLGRDPSPRRARAQ